MDENTTTEVTTETGAEAQPEQVEQTEAVQDTTVQTEEQTEAPAEPSDDEELSEWAKNKGLELDSDNAKKLAKMAREAEKAMHSKARKASELEKTLSTASDDIAEQVAENTGQDPEILKRLQRMEVKDAVGEFYNQNPDARDYEVQMVQELQNRPHLAGDLEALYALVKSRDADVVKSQAKKEALQNLAQKQQAAVPTGNAVNPSVSSNKITRAVIAEKTRQGDDAWLQKNMATINQMVAAGTLQ